MRRARTHRRGFTLIEVMVSLGIMTVGALAIIALQTQTMRANSHARQVTTATQIAQMWTERLKQDACMWTQAADPGGGNAAFVLARTQYLQSIVAAAGRWVSPPVDAPFPGISRGFDFQGDDTVANLNGAPFYCAAYRLQWVFSGSAIRSDVRVWWPRAGSEANPDDFRDCGASGNLDTLDPGGSNYDHYHAVYLSTVINVTGVPR